MKKKDRILTGKEAEEVREELEDYSLRVGWINKAYDKIQERFWKYWEEGLKPLK